MADVISNIGQALPAAATLTALYTCNAPDQAAVISSVTMCNQGVGVAKYRLSLAIAGANDTPQQYLYFDVTLQPNETQAKVIGITMGQGDVLRCQSDTGNVSFNASGVRIQ